VSVRFVKNPAFERELQATPQFAAFMDHATEATADEVRTIAESFRHTGYYLRRIRAIGRRIRVLDVFWHLVEYGSRNNSAYAPLRRGVRAAGLRLDDPRK
jgi:hypothetical protein